MSKDRDIWGIPKRKPRRHGEESPVVEAERLHRWAEIIGQMLGSLFAWRPRSAPPAAARARSLALRRVPSTEEAPPHPHARLSSPPRSALVDGLRTLARNSHGADGRAHARALDRVRAAAPDLVDYFGNDYTAAREAGLELRIALQHRAEGVALGRLLPEWRKRAAAARAARVEDDGGSAPPPPSPDTLAF
jgi:hypothetical protein